MRRFCSTLIIDFGKDDRGLVTHLALIVLVLVLLFSGLSVDSTNAWRVQFQLQTAADATAHAGSLTVRDAGGRSMGLLTRMSARESILSVANANLSEDMQDSAIKWSDITFGTWDPDTRQFTYTYPSVNAVRVTATRNTARENPLPTFLLRLTGIATRDIEVESVAYLTKQECPVGHIISNSMVEFTSNNEFYNNLCIKGADGVSLNNGNYFDDTNMIFVPDLSDMDWPSSVSMSTIVGRGTADSSATLTYADIVRTESDISAEYVADVDALATLFLDSLYEDQPDYINPSAAVIEIRARDVKYTSFIPGRIYHVECGGSKDSKAQFFKNAMVSEVVIISDCVTQLGNGSVFEDVVLISKDTSNRSVYAANGVQLGQDDACADGGGVKVYAAGDISSASGLQLYGAELSAVGEVQVAAQADGVEGVVINANGNVTFSAQASFGACTDASSSDSEYSFLIVK